MAARVLIVCLAAFALGGCIAGGETERSGSVGEEADPETLTTVGAEHGIAILGPPGTLP